MGASGCVYGGYYRAGTPQFGNEKKTGSGDHFIVEDLLDFSNKEAEEEDNAVNGGDDRSFDAETAVDSYNSSGGVQQFSGVTDACLSGDICEPYDQLAELEWLSNFVEESFSSEEIQKLQVISGVKAGSGSNSSSGSTSSSSETRPISIQSSAGILTAQNPTFFLPEPSIVPGKARSKRSRAAPNNWSSCLFVLATSPSDSDSILINPNPIKKNKKSTKRKEMPRLMVASDGRKCLHCATDRTPQWRTGPMGPKTLCNACGVRYKSGRLVPEYRPAASPTFVLSKHSNSHRKVLELRRQKEMMQQQFVGPAELGHVANEEVFIHHQLGPDFRQLI